jgi:lipooligosaccharide transport system permease protein
MMLSKAFAVWSRNFTVYKKTYKLNIVPNFFEPFFFLLSMGLGVGSYIKEMNGEPYLTFIAPGLLAAQAMMGASFEVTYNCFVKMNFGRAYDAIMATPVNVEEIALGEILWSVTRGVLYSTVFFAVLALFGVIATPTALLAIPASFLTAAMFATIGLTFTALNPTIELYSYYFTMFLSPMFLFSGVFYSISNIPDWGQALVQALPLYHAVELNRGLFQGRFDGSMGIHLGVMAAITLVCFIASVKLIRRKLVR